MVLLHRHDHLLGHNAFWLPHINRPTTSCSVTTWCYWNRSEHHSQQVWHIFQYANCFSQDCGTTSKHRAENTVSVSFMSMAVINNYTTRVEGEPWCCIAVGTTGVSAPPALEMVCMTATEGSGSRAAQLKRHYQVSSHRCLRHVWASMCRMLMCLCRNALGGQHWLSVNAVTSLQGCQL